MGFINQLITGGHHPVPGIAPGIGLFWVVDVAVKWLTLRVMIFPIISVNGAVANPCEPGLMWVWVSHGLSMFNCPKIGWLMLKTSIFTAPRLCRAPGFGPWIWCQSLVKESGYRIRYAQIEHSYIMVHKGNHPQMALIQVSEILSFTQTYPTIATIGSLNNNCSYSDPIGIFLGKWHNNCSDPLEFWMIYQCKSAKDPTQNLVLLIQKVEQSWFSTTHTHIYIDICTSTCTSDHN